MWLAGNPAADPAIWRAQIFEGAKVGSMGDAACRKRIMNYSVLAKVGRMGAAVWRELTCVIVFRRGSRVFSETGGFHLEYMSFSKTGKIGPTRDVSS